MHWALVHAKSCHALVPHSMAWLACVAARYPGRRRRTDGASLRFVDAVYEELLEALQQTRYRSVSVHTAVSAPHSPPLLILRHDVEWNPRRALTVAEMEQRHGITATYYFRVDTGAYDVPIMHRLQDMGFEVGYHFNTLDRCNGDFAAATALFEADVQRMRDAGIQVQSVKSHGDPRIAKLEYIENGDIIARDPDVLRRANVLDADVSLRACYPDSFYVSDIGIRWNPPLAGHELLDGIREQRWPVFYLMTHPDYWSRSKVRAMGLQAAAIGLRATRLNRAIATVRRGITALRELGTRPASRHP